MQNNNNKELYIRLNEGESIKLNQGNLFKIGNSTFEINSITKTQTTAAELVLT